MTPKWMNVDSMLERSRSLLTGTPIIAKPWSPERSGDSWLIVPVASGSRSSAPAAER